MDDSLKLTMEARKKLPFLPGYNFVDHGLKENHSKTHVFDIIKNEPSVKDVSKKDFSVEEISEIDKKINELKNSLEIKNKTLKKSQEIKSEKEKEEEEPEWTSTARKVLRFYGFFKEGVIESNLEQFRVRKLTIYFYLDDETIYVVENKFSNSGISQGHFIKRHKIPKSKKDGEKPSYYTGADFNIGKEVTFYSKTIRIIDCDEFTRKFLTELGVAVPNAEAYPEDQYEKIREKIQDQKSKKELNPEDRHLKRYLEYSFKGRNTNPSKKEQEQIQQFLKKDKKVLKFYCVWDDKEKLYGEKRYFILCYYLSDDKIKLSEEYSPNSGYDSFPTFVKKAKFAKPNTNPMEYYSETDLKIGEYVEAFSKKFLIYDCDEFTKKYYEKKYGIKDFTPIKVEDEKKKTKKKNINYPKYNGWGSEEDSLGSCKYLVLKPPKVDMKKFLEYDGIQLRFSGIMDTDKPEDKIREFIFCFYLSDDTLTIYEPPAKNSGIIGGKFLQRQKVKKTTDEYYKLNDFYVGAKLQIFKHKFILKTADEFTKKILESKPKQNTLDEINNLLLKLREIILQRWTRATDAFREIDLDKSGTISFSELKNLLFRLHIKCTEDQTMLIMKYFDKDGDGEINFDEFKAIVFPVDYTGIKEFEPIKEEKELMVGEGEKEKKIKETSETKAKEALRKNIFKKFKQKIEMKNFLFQETFRIMSERSFDSSMTVEDFRNVIINKMQMNISEQELEELIKFIFGENKKTGINDFVKLMDSSIFY